MTIRTSIGTAKGNDPLGAIREAAAAALRSAGDEIPRAALVLTSGAATADRLGAAARELLGSVPIAGASVAGILTDAGVLTSGAAVMCFHGDVLMPSVTCGGRAAGLLAATERAGRLMLSGACDRRHHPRGIALAFARAAAGPSTEDFLHRWRHLAGPKLRTLFSATAGDTLYGSGSEDPGDLAVLCLEGTYQSGLGLAGGFAPGETIPDAAILVHGAADAATTAVKRLEGHSLRAALIVESASRQAALGAAAHDEWMAMREQIGLDVPCLGWLSSAQGGYGRGVVSRGEDGSVLVVALGDPAVALQKAS